MSVDFEALISRAMDDVDEPTDPGMEVEPGQAVDAPRHSRPRGVRVVRVSGHRATSIGTPIPPAMVVVSAGGGGGASTLATGLGSAIATTYPGEPWLPVAVDATPAGAGDIADRAGDVAAGVATVQSWLSSGHPGRASMIHAACGLASSGLRVLRRDDSAHRESFTEIKDTLCDAGFLPIFDAGSPVSSRLVRPLLTDARLAVAITVAARADSVNRLLKTMAWLGKEIGDDAARDVLIVVSHQTEQAPVDATDHLRSRLNGWSRGVCEVPYDRHLAAGGPVVWNELAEQTRAAYRKILEALTL